MISKFDPRKICPNATAVTALLDTAAKAWGEATSRTKVVRFTWRNRKFKSTLTNFRMLVHTAKGEPVACKWGGP